MDRGRVTIPLIIGVSVAVVAVTGLYPVFTELLGRTAGDMGEMTLTLFRVFAAGVTLILLSLIAAESFGGLRQK